MVFVPPFPPDLVGDLIDNGTQFQIAGVDLTVAKIFSILDGGVIDFDNSHRLIPNYTELRKKREYWELEPSAYIIRYNEVIHIPKNAVGIVLPRSTLLRIGGTVYSALWDPGYKGKGISLMHTFTRIKIYENARIAQLILIKTDKIPSKTYAGAYQLEGLNE